MTRGKAALLLMVVFCWGGCGESKVIPPTVPASGVVTYKGAPVADADVAFQPTATDGKTAHGRTDAQGKFSLKTYISGADQADGAVKGDYKVTVTKIAAVSNAASPGDAMKKMMEAGGKPAEVKGELPEKYGKTDTTDLKATLGDKGSTDLKFELTD